MIPYQLLSDNPTWGGYDLAKDPYKRDLYSAKRPIFLSICSILLIVATPYQLLSEKRPIGKVDLGQRPLDK